MKKKNIKNGKLSAEIKECMKEKVSLIMREFKNKTLKTKYGTIVTNPKQAIAIALYSARKICDPSISKALKVKKKLVKLEKTTKKLHKMTKSFIKKTNKSNKNITNNKYKNVISKSLDKLYKMETKFNKLNKQISNIVKKINKINKNKLRVKN